MCCDWTCGYTLLSWAQIAVNMAQERMQSPTLLVEMGRASRNSTALESLKYQQYHCWQEVCSSILTASFLDVRIIVDHADRSTSNSPHRSTR